MRKDAGFNIEDRIITYYNTDEMLAKVFRSWETYIRNETLSVDMVGGLPPEGVYAETQTVDGMKLTLGVKRA